MRTGLLSETCKNCDTDTFIVPNHQISLLEQAFNSISDRNQGLKCFFVGDQCFEDLEPLFIVFNLSECFCVRFSKRIKCQMFVCAQIDSDKKERKK